MRVLGWLGDRIFGTRRHLEGVFAAVLLIPILPDLFVDWFGNPATPTRNGWLRIAAAVVSFLAALVVSLARAWWARGRAHRSRMPFTALPTADVLVVPLSVRHDKTPNYTRAGRGEREPEVPEFLAAHLRPATVVGIISPQMEALVDIVTAEFAADGITFVPVRIDDAYDPVAVTWKSDSIAAAVRVLGVAPDRIAVDVTGGTVAMTLAMMRVAAVLGAWCAYVSSRTDTDGRRVPYTQTGHAFDPHIVVETV